ncbi:MAG: hypothetical protein CL431_06990 [Acidimicrobiaceae bacterium]|jgi:hypothetical protein|nr:hypothetical protein [Acidimicrobiaceae bacterium]|tara:strand:+ start:11407 stop:12744 length:1338 start_codon:yes stop_codon:yes gene_type:complete
MRNLTYAQKFRTTATLILALILLVGCGGAELPNLVDAPPASQSALTVETLLEAPVNQSDPINPEILPNRVLDIDTISENSRGISDETIAIAIVKSGDVFQDVEIGVEARVFRLNENGGINSRKVEIVQVFDDFGDEENLETIVKEVVEQDIFGIILLSTAVSPETTDVLAENNVPFFGWGFSEGFCEPNKWGFGFNGCMNLSTSTFSDQNLDTSVMRLLSIFYGRIPQVISVTTNDPAGISVTTHNETLWGENLVKAIKLDRSEISASAILQEISSIKADVLLLSVGLDKTVEIKKELISNFSGMVLDDVTYLPGILQNFEMSEELEGGYVLSQVPPQEEYRGAATQIMTGLSQIGGPQIYSQAISIGYWSTDLLIAILDSIESELSVSSFFEKANVEGYLYDPEFSGGPCPLQTALSHQNSSGGAALLQVRGGVFRPVVNFNCP